MVAGVRGLTMVLEIDNAILREVRKHYEDALGGGKMAIAMTYSHSDHASSSPYLDDYADEPIIVVCSMNSGGGGLIRKASSRQRNSREIKVGSVNLHIFMESDEIYGKSPHTSGKIIDIDASAIGDSIASKKFIY